MKPSLTKSKLDCEKREIFFPCKISKCILGMNRGVYLTGKKSARKNKEKRTVRVNKHRLTEFSGFLTTKEIVPFAYFLFVW